MSKHIVICCDGTWNTPNDTTPTNVVKMARAVKPTASDGTVQTVFYDWGVGTEKGLDRWLGGAFGRGLLKNVEDAYRFIIHNYEPDDKLFIFGFSRGAYTARSLAGLIRNCGLLRRIHSDKVTAAFNLYRSPGFHPESDEAKLFRADNAHEIDVHFIGVWDTVGSLGIPLQGLHIFTRSQYQFHDVELSGIVKNAYHALAIDEFRWQFKPSIWKKIDKPGQHVEQVWFAGCHKDVGGGTADCGLSDIPLLWMVDKAITCGLDLDVDYLNGCVSPDPLGTLHDSRVSFYRWLPAHLRTIDDGNGQNESVWESVLQRLERLGEKYEPKNLLEYLERMGKRPMTTAH